MREVIPQNQKHLRDAFGSPITEGACVLDEEREVGYVCLEGGPHSFGPDSAHWDGWFNVTRTRGEKLLGGRLMNAACVQVLHGARS